MTRPLSRSKARSNLVLIQTSLSFTCKSGLGSLRTWFTHVTKAARSLTIQDHSKPSLSFIGPVTELALNRCIHMLINSAAINFFVMLYCSGNWRANSYRPTQVEDREDRKKSISGAAYEHVCQLVVEESSHTQLYRSYDLVSCECFHHHIATEQFLKELFFSFAGGCHTFLGYLYGAVVSLTWSCNSFTNDSLSPSKWGESITNALTTSGENRRHHKLP